MSTDAVPAKARKGIARVAEALVADTPGETLKQLVQYGRALPVLPDESRTLDSRIIGCTSQVSFWFFVINAFTMLNTNIPVIVC